MGVIELIHSVDEFLAEIIQYLADAVEEVNRVDFVIAAKDLGLNLIVVPTVRDSHSLGTQEDTGALLKLTAAITDLNRKAQLLVGKDLGNVAQIVGKIIDQGDLLAVPLDVDVAINPLLREPTVLNGGLYSGTKVGFEVGASTPCGPGIGRDLTGLGIHIREVAVVVLVATKVLHTDQVEVVRGLGGGAVAITVATDELEQVVVDKFLLCHCVSLSLFS